MDSAKSTPLIESAESDDEMEELEASMLMDSLVKKAVSTKTARKVDPCQSDKGYSGDSVVQSPLQEVQASLSQV